MTEPPKIGVLGPVRPDLALGFLGQGQPVMIGSRDPGKLDAWLRDAGPQARVGTFAETAQFGDLIVLSASNSSSSPAICSIANSVSALNRAPVQVMSGQTAPTARLMLSSGTQPLEDHRHPHNHVTCNRDRVIDGAALVAGVETAGRSQCQDNHADRGM
jgi:hypothetical protein